MRDDAAVTPPVYDATESGVKGNRLEAHVSRLDRQMGCPDYRRSLDDMDGADAPAYEQLAADVGRFVLPAVEALFREEDGR